MNLFHSFKPKQLFPSEVMAPWFQARSGPRPAQTLGLLAFDVGFVATVRMRRDALQNFPLSELQILLITDPEKDRLVDLLLAVV